MENDQIKNIGVKGLNYLETSRGVAYSAKITMDENVIGFLENEGNGGYTRVKIDPEYREEFHNRVTEHFKELNWDISNAEEYAIYYTFSGHLIDVHEEGEISKDSLELGILV